MKTIHYNHTLLSTHFIWETMWILRIHTPNISFPLWSHYDFYDYKKAKKILYKTGKYALFTVSLKWWRLLKMYAFYIQCKDKHLKLLPENLSSSFRTHFPLWLTIRKRPVQSGWSNFQSAALRVRNAQNIL